MLETNKIPFFWLNFTEIYTIGTNLRFRIFGAENSIENFIINHVRFDSSFIWREEGKKFRKFILSSELDILNIDPKHKSHSLLEIPSQ